MAAGPTLTLGGLAERPKAAVLKTAVRGDPHRGFESHTLRGGYGATDPGALPLSTPSSYASSTIG